MIDHEEIKKIVGAVPMAMLYEIVERYGVHYGGRVHIIERVWDDELQVWQYKSISPQRDFVPSDFIPAIEHAADIRRPQHDIIPPEPEYMPDKEVPCGE